MAQIIFLFTPLYGLNRSLPQTFKNSVYIVHKRCHPLTNKPEDFPQVYLIYLCINSANFLFFLKLIGIQPVVVSLLPHKLPMVALLYHAPILYNQNSVR